MSKDKESAMVQEKDPQVIFPDEDTHNADWPKRTDDRLGTLEKQAEEETVE